MGKLTDIQLRNWTKAGVPLARSDGDGLTWTLSAKGTAAWVLRYSFGRRPCELTIGRYPAITLARAREIATQQRAQIIQGVDVARVKQAENAARAAAKTFRELAESYKTVAFPRMAPNTVRQRRHHIDDILIPKLGSLAAPDVTTGHIVALVEGIGARSKSVAELVFTAVSEIFKHGLARHAVRSNPCTGITVAAICGSRDPRKRLKLTPDELRAVLAGLPTIGEENALAVRILLATCVRISELASARWKDVNFRQAVWTIPHSKGKQDQPFAIPLCPDVAGWFRRLETLACGSPFVLPARNVRRRATAGGAAHFEQRALNAMLHKLCDQLADKVRRFTPHDLRSTARSYLSELGVKVEVAERCLNHTIGGVIGVYDQHDYLVERREALQRWTDFILDHDEGVSALPSNMGALAHIPAPSMAHHNG